MSAGAVVARRGVLEVVASPDYLGKVEAATGGDKTEAARFVRTMLTALQLDPDLILQDRSSLLNSGLRCAQDKLVPDGREAAFVVFGGKVAYMPMVVGLRKRAAEFGVSIAAHVVCAGDDFDYELGFEPVVLHKPPKLGVDRGAAIGAYAVATDKQGRKYLEVMSKSDIEKVRSASRAKGSGPWTQWWDEMARKTVARRLFKSLPLHHESIASLMAAVDAEFEHQTAEQRVDRALGHVGPPADNEVPDDFIEGEAFEEELAGEPEAVADSGAVSQADAEERPGSAPAAAEPASPAQHVPPMGEGEHGQSRFAEMADKAQKTRRPHRDPS